MKILLKYFYAHIQNSSLEVVYILFYGLLFLAVFGLLYMKRRGTRAEVVIKDIISILLLSINCSVIFVMTLYRREISEQVVFELVPLNSYFKAYKQGDPELSLQILMNIVIYIPFGYLLLYFLKKYIYIVFVSFSCSLFIELVQGFWKIGVFEIDDIINNTLGAVIGGLFCWAYRSRRK